MSLFKMPLPPYGALAATQVISEQRLVYISDSFAPKVMIEIALVNANVNGDNARVSLHDLAGNREVAFSFPLPEDPNTMFPKARVVQMFAFLDLTVWDDEMERITLNINRQVHYWASQI